MYKSTILIIEDNKVITDLLIKHLTDAKYIVNSSESITNAKRLLCKKHFDLIILDVQLPDGNGLELLHYIRNEYEFSEIKVIILTQNTSITSRLKSFKIGADDYVPKPFYPKELIARIDKQLQNINNKNEIKYKGLILNWETNDIKFQNKVICLTNLETYFIGFQMQLPQTRSREKLRIFLNTKLKKRLSDKSINVCATRLKSKFKRNYNNEIFKSKYGKGYYINI